MRKTATSMTIAFTIALAVISCCLRFFQLLSFTDATTGLVDDSRNMSLFIYIIALLAFGVSTLYATRMKGESASIHLVGNNNMYFSLVLLYGAYFFDFIHQCYNTYKYIANTEYVEYGYIIPLAISGVGAIFSAFYVYICSLTVRGSNYDFRSFTLLHFAPFLWGFGRLICIMVRIIDIKSGVESFCELIFIASFLMLTLSIAGAVDRDSGVATAAMSFSSVMTLYSGIVISIPRIVMILSHQADKLYRVDFSCLTYLACASLASELILSYKYNHSEE